jgi:glycosyltransferase involved in cell wall biosynthesis
MDNFNTLSIIVPVYNEAATIGVILGRLHDLTLIRGIQKELIIINDGSTDNTEQLIEDYFRTHPGIAFHYFKHPVNKGKGAAIHSGIALASGQYIIIQDADLEYDPQDINVLLGPVFKRGADVVYGSRFPGGESRGVLFFWHSVGNRFLTGLSNIFANLNLTDMETCYKLFRAPLIKGLNLKERRFGFEPEVTAKISRLPDIRISEVNISYNGRTYKEGKKINWTDGIRALVCIIKYNPHFRYLIFLALAIYLLQCFTPLRLEFDSIRYFRIRDCLQYGCPPGSKGAKDFLPYGYPAFLLIFSKLGLLRSFTIVLINGIYLLTGLYFVRKIFGNAIRPLPFYAILLLNWVFIKFVEYPLSEMQFLFFSTGSMYFFVSYTRTRKWGMLAAAFGFAALAFFTRTVGIALLPGLLAGLAWEHREGLRRGATRNIVLLVSLILTALVALSWKLLGLQHYLGVLSQRNQDGPGRLTVLSEHAKEWGQLFLNTPIGKPAAYLGPGFVNGLMPVAGTLSFGWFVYSFWKLSRASIRTKTIPGGVPMTTSMALPMAVTVYLIAYFLIIIYWPFFDPRFWAPVLPFVAAILFQTPIPVVSRIRFVRPLGSGIYLLGGVLALGFSLYTQFNKPAFARTQAKGIFRNEYETHFFGRPLSDTTTPVRQDVLHVLERFD